MFYQTLRLRFVTKTFGRDSRSGVAWTLQIGSAAKRRQLGAPLATEIVDDARMERAP